MERKVEFAAAGTVTPQAFPDVNIPVAELFGQAPVGDDPCGAGFQTILRASSNGKRGLRGNSISVISLPSAQMKFDLTEVPPKNAASTLAYRTPTSARYRRRGGLNCRQWCNGSASGWAGTWSGAGCWCGICRAAIWTWHRNRKRRGMRCRDCKGPHRARPAARAQGLHAANAGAAHGGLRERVGCASERIFLSGRGGGAST